MSLAGNGKKGIGYISTENGFQCSCIILETARYKLGQNNPTPLLSYLLFFFVFFWEMHGKIQLVPGKTSFKDPVYNRRGGLSDHSHYLRVYD